MEFILWTMHFADKLVLNKVPAEMPGILIEPVQVGQTHTFSSNKL